MPDNPRMNVTLTPELEAFVRQRVDGGEFRSADAVVCEGLLEACQQVADGPDLGHWRHDLTNKPVRFFTVRGTYLIAFDPASVPLEVVRIFHGAQDVATDLYG